jgi:hypothetical protein
VKPTTSAYSADAAPTTPPYSGRGRPPVPRYQVGKRSGFYPCPNVDTAGSNVVSLAGGVLLTETIRAVRLGQAIPAELGRWRFSNAVHDPGRSCWISR